MSRAIFIMALLGCSAAALFTAAPAVRNEPLFPGSKFTQADRKIALRRGMTFLLDLAHQPKIFADYGHDLLWCLYSLGATSADPELSARARAAGTELAREFRRQYPTLEANADADTIQWLVFGSYAADQLGVRDDRLKEQLRRAAPRFSARDYLDFDPLREPPPSDVPAPCPKCDHLDVRGTKRCSRCGTELKMQTPYTAWYVALIAAYTGDKYGVPLGASYRDVYRWASTMRPYPPRTSNRDFYGKVYAATHVVYTQNDYSQYRVDPACLPDEFQFLRASALEAVRLNDAETMGEFLDSLRAFGLDERDIIVQRGFEYLLSSQNPDGSWGNVKDPEPYNRYHPTWTAIDGLREYRWSKTVCPAR